jgi:hypothetical protein
VIVLDGSLLTLRVEVYEGTRAVWLEFYDAE